MKRMTAVIMMCLAAPLALASEIVVQKSQGDVSVRQGVTETWTPVRAGTALDPGATIRTGPRSAAVLVVPGKIIRLPAQVMVDVSDIRDLSQEELMLKLTMQKVRESPYQRKGSPGEAPNAAVVHGTDAARSPGLTENDAATGEFLLNGTRVLFDNGFYSTCALKTLEVVRRYPALRTFDTGWMTGEALEKAGLRGEALSAFGELSRQALEPEQLEKVQAKIAALKTAR